LNADFTPEKFICQMGLILVTESSLEPFLLFAYDVQLQLTNAGWSGSLTAWGAQGRQTSLTALCNRSTQQEHFYLFQVDSFTEIKHCSQIFQNLRRKQSSINHLLVYSVEIQAQRYVPFILLSFLTLEYLPS